MGTHRSGDAQPDLEEKSITMPTLPPFRTEPKPEPRKPTSDQKLYRSSRWQEVRKLHLSQNPYCRAHWDVKGELVDCTFGAPVDHIIPVTLGGAPLDFRNLMTLCPKCHDTKSAMERHLGCLVEYEGEEGERYPKEGSLVELLARICPK